MSRQSPCPQVALNGSLACIILSRSRSQGFAETFGAILNNQSAKASATGLEGIPWINTIAELILNGLFKFSARDPVAIAGRVLVMFLSITENIDGGFDALTLFTGL